MRKKIIGYVLSHPGARRWDLNAILEDGAKWFLGTFPTRANARLMLRWHQIHD